MKTSDSVSQWAINRKGFQRTQSRDTIEIDTIVSVEASSKGGKAAEQPDVRVRDLRHREHRATSAVSLD